MNSRRILAFAIILFLVATPFIPNQPARAASNYTEKLAVYIAGGDAYWAITLGGINASNSAISQVESIGGVNWYNVTAVKSTAWVSDFQVFGKQGYNVLPLPFIPQQGLFLKVGASDFSSAFSAAKALGPYLVTSFVSLSNSSGVFTFYSPLSFNTVVPLTLMRLIPVSHGGFATLVGYKSPASPGNFTSLQGPMITLEGDRGSSGFTHSLTLADVSSSGLSSLNSPSLLNYFGQARSSIQSANSSISSTIVVHTLDGVMAPTSLTQVTNDRGSFQGSYLYNLKPGQKVSSLNVTVVEQPPVVVGTRTIDNGVLNANDTVTVTDSFSVYPSGLKAFNVTLNDNWWQSLGYFKLVGGSSNISLPQIPASKGKTSSGFYTLKYTGHGPQNVSIPASAVSYGARYNTTVGAKTTSSALTFYANINGAFLSLGTAEPVLYSYVTPSTGFGSSVGGTQNVKLVVKNVGTRTATSVFAAGQQVGPISPQANASVIVPLAAGGITKNNVTAGFTVSFTPTQGKSVTIVTNNFAALFPHNAMKMGYTTTSNNATLTQLKQTSQFNLTLTFTTVNSGNGNTTGFTASEVLPAGLSCGKVLGNNITCSSGVITILYPKLVPHATKHNAVSFNVTTSRNFIFPPLSFSSVSAGVTFSGMSGAEPAPLGFAFTKSFSPSKLFGSMNSQVTVVATNGGPFNVYNATVSTSADPFDTLPIGARPTQATNHTIAPGGSLAFSYNVTMSSSPGNQSGAGIGGTFYFGGEGFRVQRASSNVVIYNSPSVTITSSPTSPEEGHSFTMTVKIANPAGVDLANVQYSLPLPPEVSPTQLNNATFANGVLKFSVASLKAGGTYSANVTVSPSSGVSVPFGSSKLTFVYAGITLNGKVPTTGIAVNENVTTRYVIPVAVAILFLLLAAFVVRRMAKPTARASPQ